MKPKPVSRLCLALLASVLLTSGCTTRYEVKVDAIARTRGGTGDYSSYQIRTPNPQLATARPDFRETAQYVKTALSGHGLYEAPVGTEPDLIIEIDYGMDAPRAKQETIMIPIYGDQGGINQPRHLPLQDEIEDRHVRRAGAAQPGSREVIGYQEETRTVTVREKYLLVSGLENQSAGEGRPPNEVFNIRVTAENASSDLRAHVPVLAGAMMEKLGQTTDGIVTARVPADHQSVAFIKRGF
jgi:hypothetical protein